MAELQEPRAEKKEKIWKREAGFVLYCFVFVCLLFVLKNQFR